MRKSNFLKIMIIGFAVIFIALPLFAAVNSRQAAVELAPLGLNISPQCDFERLELNLNGPKDLSYHQRLEKGGFVNLFEQIDRALPDGAYAYEIELVGCAETVSGYFRIFEGRLVTEPVKEVTTKVVHDDACIGEDCGPGDEGEPLRLKNETLEITFTDSSTTASVPTNDWQITVNDSTVDRFSLEDLEAETTPVTIEASAPDHSLYVDDSGNVGIGTSTPGFPLHIRRSDGSARIFVQDTNSSGEILMSLQGWGATVRTEWYATGGSTPWFAGHRASNDRFFIRSVGASADNFAVDTSGNVYVSNVMVHSSRTLKDNIEAVDPVEVLNKVLAIPMHEWTFSNELAVGTRHLSPMAEDFWAAFELGSDDQHVSPTDTAGVALAAIQGLHRLVEEKDAEIVELKDRLAQLEALVSRLAAQQ